MRHLARRTVLPLIALLTVPAPAVGAQEEGGRMAGEWIFEMAGDPQPQRVTLTMTGDSVGGRVYGQPLVGRLAGQRLTFAVGDYRWRATLRRDSLIDGWLRIGEDSSRWVGTRYRRPARARSLTLDPTTWHRRLAPDVTPVLRIHAGDTVDTWTLDAGGRGRGPFAAKGSRVAMGGNPLVGPFYVEGAVPGDVLVVHLHRVRLNRDWAASGTGLVDNAIEPAYAAERTSAPVDRMWVLDTVAGVARLAKPTPALAGYTTPLRPFLGVIAVAPGGDWTPTSRESGSFGGNLEYARLREGAAIHLPVGTMGAYLYLGDGHAAQGDGEVTGDALETTMNVRFSVEVIRWGFRSVVRAEDAEAIMSLGVGGSLDEAMRRATSDMARWLERDYGLTSNEAALVLGTALAYDIPDVVPPGYGVVARLPRSAIEQLRRPPGT